MTIQSMTLVPAQRGAAARTDTAGRWLPDTVGPTDFCLNMRERRPGSLEAVGRPKTLAFLGANTVGSDTRGARTYIFSQTTDHKLYIEGYMRADSTFVAARTEVGTLPGAVTAMAVCGQFLVLTVADTPLHYMLWNPDLETYTLLGAMPAAPEFTAWASSTAAVTTDIAPTTFGQTVADMRQTIPACVRTPLSKAVTDAYHEAVSAAEAAGLFVQPVMVRLAVRLWDGSLLHLTAPQLVHGPTPFTTGDITMVPLTKETTGFTGTQTGVFELTGYRLRVSVGNHDLGRWADVVRGIEVWVTAQNDAIDTARALDMAHRQTSAGYFVAVQVPRLTDSQLTARMMQSPWLMQQALSTQMTGAVTLRAGHRRVVPDPFARLSQLYGMKAAATTGHGDFLHMADVTRHRPEVPLPGGVTPNSASGTLMLMGVTMGEAGVSGRCRTLRVNPVSSLGALVWYPSASASQISICVAGADGSVAGVQLPLTPAPGGEDAAYYLHDNLKTIPLEADYEPPMPTDRPDERHPSEVLTSAPGNPFVAVGSTRYCGSTVRALAAQQIGGGAYTRQYIYALTDTGITAVTHDPTGHHTNHRPISSLRTTRKTAVCTTSTGVYVLTDDGHLLRIRDVMVATLLSGLPPYTSLAWHDALAELWLMPDATAGKMPGWSLVVQPCADFRAYLRSEQPHTVLSRGPVPLFVTPPATGQKSYILWTPDADIAPEADRLRSDSVWVSAPEAAGMHGRCTAAFGLEGRGTICTLTVSSARRGEEWQPLDEEPAALLRLDVSGDAYDHIEAPLMLPQLKGYTTHIRWRAEGAIPRLTGTSIMNCAL